MKNNLRKTYLISVLILLGTLVFDLLFSLSDQSLVKAAISGGSSGSTNYTLRVSYPFSSLDNGDTKTIEAKIFDRNGGEVDRRRGFPPIFWSYRNVGTANNSLTSPNGDSSGGMGRCNAFQTGTTTWCYEEDIDYSLPDYSSVCAPGTCPFYPDNGSKFYYRAQWNETSRPYIFDLVAQVIHEGEFLQAVARFQVNSNSQSGCTFGIIESSGISYWTVGQTATYDMILRSREGNSIPILGKIDWTVATSDYTARYVQEDGSFGYERHLENGGRRLNLTPNISNATYYLYETSARANFTQFGDCSGQNIEFEGNLADSTITDTFTGTIPPQR